MDIFDKDGFDRGVALALQDCSKARNAFFQCIKNQRKTSVQASERLPCPKNCKILRARYEWDCTPQLVEFYNKQYLLGVKRGASMENPIILDP